MAKQRLAYVMCVGMLMSAPAMSIAQTREAEREIVSRYHAAFSEVLFLTGMPRATTRQLNTWPSYAVTFEAPEGA